LRDHLVVDQSLNLPNCLNLIEASLAEWQPVERFDSITCVHGLHYIGDKLGLITRAVSWLKNDGQFVANLDLNNVKLAGPQSSTRSAAKEIRNAGIRFDSRKKLIQCFGRTHIKLPYRYLGADDQAGPNYTNQPVVDSHYAIDDTQCGDEVSTTLPVELPMIPVLVKKSIPNSGITKVDIKWHTG